MSAPEVTSGAALLLHGRDPEGREANNRAHARRPASGTGRGLPRESRAWQVLLLFGARGPSRGSPSSAVAEAWGWGPCCSLGRTQGADLAPFILTAPARPWTWPLKMSFRKAINWP